MYENEGIPEDVCVLDIQITDREASRVLNIPPELLQVFRSFQVGPQSFDGPSGEPMYDFSEICVWLFYKLFEPSNYVKAVEDAFARKETAHTAESR